MSQLADTPSLKVHEWVAIAILISALLTLSLMTHVSHLSADSALSTCFAYHEIIIKGAVAYPGIYRIPSEMPLKEVLALAGVSPQANLSRFKLDNPVKKGRILHIPVKRTERMVRTRGRGP